MEQCNSDCGTEEQLGRTVEQWKRDGGTVEQ